MQNSIQIFESNEFGKLEVLTIDGKPFFPANDCAKALGYKDATNAIKQHCKGVVKHHLLTNGGKQTKNYIPEGDLYRLIIRSKLPAAVRFESFVCDIVLPSVRQHGAYIHDDILEQMRNSSEFADELILRLSKEREKTEILQCFLDAAAPKVRYHDIILQCPNPVQVTIIAKDYGMSAVKFNKMLHSLGIQFKMGKTWLLYSKYAGNGYTVTKTYITDGNIASIHTLFTQKGRRFLYDFLAGYGILPQSEIIGAGS